MTAILPDFARQPSSGGGGGGGGSGISVGNILYSGNPTVPIGFLICDGSIVSRTTYSSLFSLIGVSFGAGDGSTTFALPYKPVTLGAITDVTPPTGASQGMLLTTLADGRILSVNGTATYLGTINANSTITWVASTAYPISVTFGQIFTLNDGRVLYVGGVVGGAVVATSYIGTVTGNTIAWVASTALPAVRSLAAHMLLPDGRVLIVAGAATPFGTNQSTTYFGTISGNTITWVAGTAYPLSIRELSGAVCTDGSVLLVGGYTAQSLTSCYIGTISGNTITWVATGALPEIKAGHPTLVLPNNDIIAISGNRGGANYTSNIAIGHRSKKEVQWFTDIVPLSTRISYFGACRAGNRIIVMHSSTESYSIPILYPIIKV